jgi:hypothetical protein
LGCHSDENTGKCHNEHNTLHGYTIGDKVRSLQILINQCQNRKRGNEHRDSEPRKPFGNARPVMAAATETMFIFVTLRGKGFYQLSRVLPKVPAHRTSVPKVVLLPSILALWTTDSDKDCGTMRTDLIILTDRGTTIFTDKMPAQHY